MDQIKIGRFIAERRKAVGLTQMQLAELLSITDRAVSKWENGRSMPDSSIMLELCKILKINVNDLLHGEVITMENYNKEAEKVMLDMVKQKEENDRQLLTLEIVIGVICMVYLLALTFLAAFLPMADWLRIVVIVGAFIPTLVGIGFAIRIEQTAGYYECAKCKHRYVPSYSSVLWAMHMGRTRYMKCPKCQQRSWQKKRIEKE